MPVIIPDAVFFEATNAAGKLGAQEILDWYRDHMDAVRVEPTEAFAAAQLAARAGRRQRDLGERASLEVIRNYPLAQNERALYRPVSKHTRRQNTTCRKPQISPRPIGVCSAAKRRSCQRRRPGPCPGHKKSETAISKIGCIVLPVCCVKMTRVIVARPAAVDPSPDDLSC